MFHDGNKKWSCCGAKSHDFATFMELPGCEVGRHTQQKPPKPAPSPNAPTAPPIPLSVEARTKAATAATAGVRTHVDAAAASSAKEECPRCRQGFFCSDHAQSAEAQAAYVAPKPKAPPVARTTDPHARQTCRNKGCGNAFTEATNGDDVCLHHPGPPIFHERQKGWSCCNKICYDFDEFMNIPPCTRGRHNADPEEREYAKKAPK